MTEQHTPHNASQNAGQYINTQSIGATLSEARSAKGLDIQSISEDLCIPARFLVALESDDFQSLPEIIFARGYLRTYGRYLEIDTDELVTQFNEKYDHSSSSALAATAKSTQAAVAQTAAQANLAASSTRGASTSLSNSPEISRVRSPESRLRLRKWIIAAASLVVLAAVVWLSVPYVQQGIAWVKQKLAHQTSAETHTVAQDINTSAASVVTHQSATMTSQVAASQVTDTNALVHIAPSARSGESRVTVKSSPAAGAADQLQLSLSAPTDVMVSDASGKVLLRGLQKSNSAAAPLTVSGAAPFKVAIGSANASALTFNGVRIDLKPLTTKGRAAFYISQHSAQ